MSSLQPLLIHDGSLFGSLILPRLIFASGRRELVCPFGSSDRQDQTLAPSRKEREIQIIT